MVFDKKETKEYIPIRIDTMSDNTKITFDLYTLENERYFLFCGANSNFMKSDLSRTYVKRHKNLYIKKQHKKKYRDYVEKHLPDILGNEEIESDEKVSIVHDVSNAMTSRMFDDEVFPESSRVENFISNTMDFMFREKLSMGQLIKFAEHDFYTYTHSLHVFMYSSMFAAFLGMKREESFKSMCLGSFLHDIGKSKISAEIINKSGPLNNEEWEKMQQHPLIGYKIVKKEMGISDEILSGIILNHHERINGKGYPRGISKIKIYDRIVAIADTYDAITSNRSYQRGKKAFEAMRYLFETQKDRLDMDLLKKFAIMLGAA